MKHNHPIRRLAMAATLAALAALGGCGSDDDAAVLPPGPDVLTLSGTAATGAAIAGGAVSVRCTTGSTSATTSATGAFMATVDGGRLPCALRVTDAGGAMLHSVVAGSGSGSFNVNLSPLTDMVVASASGMAPSAYYDGLSSGTALSAATLTDAVSSVRAQLAGVVDLSGVNPLSDTLVAASPGVAGNALDQKIDAAVAALDAAGLSLADASAAIAANPRSGDVLKSVLQPRASDCSRARSGKYRMLDASEPDPKWRAHVINIDMVAMTVTDQDANTIPFTSLGGCKFSIVDDEGTNSVVVAPSGVLVVNTLHTDNSRSITIGLPEQALPITELAGTWHVLGWGSNGSGLVADTQEAVLNSAGSVTAVSNCVGSMPCTSDGAGPFGTFAANTTAGGFDFIEGGTVNGRAFVFKTVAGASVGVLVLNDGQVVILARKQAIAALPALNSQNLFWDFTLNGNGSVSGDFVEDVVTVTAVDATTKVVTRIRGSDARVDQLAYDSPRDGLRYRAPNSCTRNGVAINCAEVVQLPLQGIGITLSASVSSNPATSFLSVSVARP